MIKLIISDLERTIYRKNTKVLFALAAFLPIIIYWAVSYQVRCGGNSGMDSLNSLNYPVHFVDEFNLVLVSIIAPLFFNEVLSSDVDSGAYRLIAIKPFNKWKFIVSKWISSAIIYLFMIFTVFIIKTVIGFLFMPKVTYTSYLNINEKLNLISAVFYNVKFYLIIFAIHMTILALTSFISVIFQKTIVTFAATVGAILGSVYFSKAANNVIFNISSYVSNLLGGVYNLSSILGIVIVEFTLFAVSLYLWNRNIGTNV